MASNVNPTVRRRRLGQELRRLREQKGMTAEEVAERLLVSQSKISRLENGRRSISQRDVRDLCGVYEVEDQRMVDSLMEMAKDSRQQGWWHAFGDVPYSVYIGLETDAASLRVYDPQVVPGAVADPPVRGGAHHGRAAGGRRQRHRQPGPGAPAPAGADHRPGEPAAAVDGDRRGGAAPRRGQPAADAGAAGVTWSSSPSCRMSPCRCIPFEMGAHPGLNGQYAILEFPDAADSSVVYIEGVTSDLYLEKAHDVQKYSVMYEHLRAQALNVDQSRQFIADLAKEYAR